MEHEKEPSEIEDLIIEYAFIAVEDDTVCELIRRQDEIAEEDPVAASDIEGLLDAKVYDFLKKKTICQACSPNEDGSPSGSNDSQWRFGADRFC